MNMIKTKILLFVLLINSLNASSINSGNTTYECEEFSLNLFHESNYTFSFSEVNNNTFNFSFFKNGIEYENIVISVVD